MRTSLGADGEHVCASMHEAREGGHEDEGDSVMEVLGRNISPVAAIHVLAAKC